MGIDGGRRVSSSLGWLAFFLIVGSGCNTLPILEPLTCGNGVIDDVTEDCDGVAPAGSSCRAPGSVAACRFDCSEGAVCPAGYACGADLVCRAAFGGAFHAARQVDSADARDVRVGNVDGEGPRDEAVVLRGDGLAILSLGPAGATDALAVESSSLLRGVRATPELADLTGDGALDIAFADRGLVVARADQGVLPVPSPSIAVESTMLLADVVVPGESGVPLGLGHGSEIVAWKNGSFEARFGSQPVLLGPFPPDPDVTWKASAIGQFREGPTSPCQEIAVVHGTNAQDTKISVFTPCALNGPDVEPNAGGVIPTVDVQLSPGTSEILGMLVADVDRDGHLDIVVAGAENVYVAYGDGAGAFQSAPCGGGTPGQADALPLGLVAFRLLALADLNGDGRLDVVEQGVSESVIRLSTQALAPGDCDAAPFTTLGGPSASASSSVGWQQVAVGDLTGDGFLDVVAISPLSGLVDQGIDFYAGGPGGFFTYTRLDVGAAVAAIQLGDFDGNGLADIAAVGVDGDPDAPTNELFVLFGAPFAPPTTLASLGVVGEVLSLASGDVQPTFSSNVDQPDELLVITKVADQKLAAVFSGASSQQLFAPLLTPDPVEADVVTLPVRAVTGRFTSPDAPTVAMVSHSATTDDATDRDRVWVADNDGAGGLSVPATAFAPAGAAGLKTTLGLPVGGTTKLPLFAPLDTSVLAAADVDGDGLDEILFFGFTSIGGGMPPGGVVAKLAPGGTPDVVSATTDLTFVSVEEKEGKITSFATQILQSLRSKAIAVDLDGDGDEEVVVLAGKFGMGPACHSAGVIAIYDGDGAGFLDVAGARVVAPSQSLPDEYDETYLSFAIAEVDGDPEPEIVVLARPRRPSCADGYDATPPARLFYVDVKPAGASFAEWTFEPKPLVTSQGELSMQVVTLASGDVNGDGLADLVGAGVDGTFVALGFDRLLGGAQ